MLWYQTVLYPAIINISFLLALILKFLLLVNCFTESVIFSNSHTTATEKVGQHNCQGDFNLVHRIILCRSSERHSSFPKCLLPVTSLLSRSKSQHRFYFTIYDKNFCVKSLFIQVTKNFHYISAFLVSSWCSYSQCTLNRIFFGEIIINILALKPLRLDLEYKGKINQLCFILIVCTM